MINEGNEVIVVEGDVTKLSKAEYARAWRLANPEKARAGYRRWREGNKAAVREYNRKYVALHPEENREQVMRWRKDNLEAYREYQREYHRLYRAANREKLNQYSSEWAKTKRAKGNNDGE